MVVTPPEAANIIAVLVIPFGKSSGELANLIAARADIPWLHDELETLQHGVLCNGCKQRRMGIKPRRSAPQCRPQIKAETVYAGFNCPSAQGIHRKPHHWQAIAGQNISAACIVDIRARVIRLQPIVTGVVETAQRDRRPQRIPLAGVVEHNINNNLNARTVQLRDGCANLNPATRRQMRCWRTPANRVITPVVGQPEGSQMPLVDASSNGQNFNRCHAKAC